VDILTNSDPGPRFKAGEVEGEENGEVERVFHDPWNEVPYWRSWNENAAQDVSGGIHGGGGKERNDDQ
jgi:hypothetical protein